jgi:hypothetical protein
MAGLGRKVFTAGDVLTASDLQNYMMDQTVMNFAGTAARSSAIATPTTGMTTYIGTTGTATISQIETYTGSTWQTPYGISLLSTTSVSGASTISINNVFSSAYDNYKLVIDMTGSAAVSLQMRVRASGTDSSAAAYNYSSAFFFMVAGTNSDTRAMAATSFALPALNSGTVSSYFLDIQNIAKASTTQIMGQAIRFNSEAGYLFSGINTGLVAYDGITIFPASGTITGTIKIYGYRNS